MKGEIVSIIIGDLETIPTNLKRNFETIECRITQGVLQKNVLLVTTHIIHVACNLCYSNSAGYVME